MKKIILSFALLTCSFLANALPNRYEALNLNQQQYQQVQQIVNKYDYDIQRTLTMIHNKGVSLNQVSKLPTTKENRIAKAQQLSMLSEGSGFLNSRLSFLLGQRDKEVMSVLNQQQANILMNTPPERIVIAGGNHLTPIR